MEDVGAFPSGSVLHRHGVRPQPWAADGEEAEGAEEGQYGRAAQDGLDGGAVGGRGGGEPLTASRTVAAIVTLTAPNSTSDVRTRPDAAPVRSAGTCAWVATFVSVHPSPMPTPQITKTTAYQPRGRTQVSASNPAPLVSMPQAIRVSACQRSARCPAW